jgi:Ni/Fe-hydrogenase subunit HybB-like protein
VVSVHSVVSADFATSVIPAWHETVFPPYFVAGAIFSGFAMVLVLCIPIRHIYKLKDFITLDHLDVMGKLVLATSFMTSYGYLSEQFLSLYAGEAVERYVYTNRLIAFDQFAVITWILFTCNTIVPQLLWFRRLRRKESVLMIVSLLILVGMWLERYMIITTSLHRDHLPSSWGMFLPTIWDIATYVGSIGVFLTAFLLFARFLPLLSMSETKALLPGAHGTEVGR